MTENALYYPYIHIRDLNWLKGTLLIFSQVRRMLPGGFDPHDTPELREFARRRGRLRPLLARTNLGTRRSRHAQKELASKLLSEGDEFRAKYGWAATEEGQGADLLGFQIHNQKLTNQLKSSLRESGLAWDPNRREPYDLNAEYVAMNPAVGQAVMSTIAIACAEGEGLDIVGDRRSRELHDCLIDKGADSVYDAWLHPESHVQQPKAATGKELLEFIIALECDVTALDADTLASMGEDRAPIRALLARLQEHASNIAAMDPSSQRQERVEDEVADVLAGWKEDRANMSAFWRRFYGDGLVDATARFAKEVLAKFATSGAAGGAGAAGVAGAAGAGVVTGALAGAGAGLGVGLIVHAGKSYADMRKAERESAYRYLTILEDAGVVFRSQLRRDLRPN